MQLLQISPLRWYERAANVAMIPLMYLVAGTVTESPQRTHRWNYHNLSVRRANNLRLGECVQCDRLPDAAQRYRYGLPISHLPILGGWRTYAVLAPRSDTDWHVGWKTVDAVGVSRIRLHGAVRMLLGPKPVTFFACDPAGYQIELQQLTHGRIGEGGDFSHVPLL